MTEWIIITILAALLVVQTWYYIERTWETNRAHQRHLEDLRHEYRIQDQMMRGLTLPMMGGNDE